MISIIGIIGIKGSTGITWQTAAVSRFQSTYCSCFLSYLSSRTRQHYSYIYVFVYIYIYTSIYTWQTTAVSRKLLRHVHRGDHCRKQIVNTYFAIMALLWTPSVYWFEVEDFCLLAVRDYKSNEYPDNMTPEWSRQNDNINRIDRSNVDRLGTTKCKKVQNILW